MNLKFRMCISVICMGLLCGFVANAGYGADADGQKCSMIVSVPQGWQSVPDIAQQMNVPVILTVEGYDFNSSPAVMYARFMEGHPGRSLDQLVEKDIESFKRAYPERGKADTHEERIEGRRYIWCKFEGGGSNAYELVVYTQYADCQYIYVLSAMNKENLSVAEPWFVEFLNGIRPMVKVD